MASAKRILIAEDEIPIAKSLANKLISEGFSVESVTDGAEAIAALGKKHFDLLLLDLIMPETDGFYVLEELKKERNTIKVAVLTNLSQAEDIERVQALGVKEFFVKSNTSLSEIVEHVKRIIK